MTTPMMKQLHAAKREHPDGLLFFRMGDFFELFGEDAVLASELLNLTLTSRDKGENALPMAGVPARSVDRYINRLISMGRKVVVCDQVQDPSEARGLVERAVTRVVTPGTVLEEEGLEEKENNFLCAVLLSGDVAGLAYADVSTGTFLLEEVPASQAIEGVLQLAPAECLLPESALDADSPYARLRDAIECTASTVPDWRFDGDEAERLLTDHFKVAKLDGFGVSDLGAAIGAAGAILHYLLETQKGALGHLTRMRRVRREDYMVLDRTTRTSLELVRTLRDGERKGSLVWVLDRTLTPMGGRLLKDWILQPLKDVPGIQRRQAGVQELLDEETVREDLRARLKTVLDVERLLARIACGRASARELVGLRASLRVLPDVVAVLHDGWSDVLKETVSGLPDLADLTDLLDRALMDEVPPTVREGGIVRDGFDPELDELRELGGENRAWIANFQDSESKRTGIPNLKVGYNRVFGYYIEITHLHAGRAPETYIRKQTLKNAERYITPELKEYEERILGAEEKIKEREYEHFLRLRDAIRDRLTEVQAASDALATLDGLQSLAQVARENRFVRPEVDTSRDIVIREGRHAVLDALPSDRAFVPNDLDFAAGTREMVVITGPNMAGKSTYIRQAALLVIMAQAGSFVPADSARIGVADRVFTRVGASDELQRGNSTFMVEMIETAEILNNATDSSLVILDEVGRGTSTFDGLAIAWAITEYLASEVHCRALFATHYHQLLDLAEKLPNACNMNVAVREWGDDIVFLHKMVDGGTDRSYGIHVARLAGLPKEVLDRASSVLDGIESETVVTPAASDSSAPHQQLSLFGEPEDPLRKELRGVEPDQLTPMDALLLLQRLKGL
ncbi:MAG: DNA mismatch repair protein MutS [Planctomycetes bacterium]|nr:DNA mismatch repair protein MutS [Planctomycetota bacterium]